MKKNLILFILSILIWVIFICMDYQRMHASDYLEKFRLLINRMMPLALINAVLALIGVIFTLLKWEKLDRVGKGLGLLPAMLFIIIFFDFNNWMYYTTKEGGFIDMVLNKFSSGK